MTTTLMEETVSKTNGQRWWKGRAALDRLFQGYFRDFGDDAKEIAEIIVTCLGGYRMTIPERLSGSENSMALVGLFGCLCDRIGRSSAEAVMRKFIIELKGLRVSFPDYRDLYREERNRRIRARFTGDNYSELAILFGLNRSMIWRIINDGKEE